MSRNVRMRGLLHQDSEFLARATRRRPGRGMAGGTRCKCEWEWSEVMETMHIDTTFEKCVSVSRGIGRAELRVLTCSAINSTIFVSDLIFIHNSLGCRSDGRRWTLVSGHYRLFLYLTHASWLIHLSICMPAWLKIHIMSNTVQNKKYSWIIKSSVKEKLRTQ